MRLNKYLSESGACSRREADALHRRGPRHGQRRARRRSARRSTTATTSGSTAIASARRARRSQPVYIALNKPVGITCTTERHVDGNIVDFVDHTERVFPIGRLDKDSEGLILLTNDGDIVNEVLRAEHNHEKEYVVAVDRAITPEFVDAAWPRACGSSDATTQAVQGRASSARRCSRSSSRRASTARSGGCARRSATRSRRCSASASCTSSSASCRSAAGAT